MEFFELGTERIHHLISLCFSQALERGLFFASLGLSLGILLTIFCKKLNLFKRDKKVFQTVSSIYYLYIPFVFTLGSFVIGASWAAKFFFVSETETNISPLMKFVFPAYQSEVNTNWARVVQTKMTFNETVDEYVAQINFTPRNNDFNELWATYTANIMVPKITKWGIESVVSAAKDIALKQSEEQGYIEINKVKALLIVRSMSMFDYPQGLWEEANEKLEEKAVYFFEGTTGNISMIFVLLGFLPFAETIIYKIFMRKKLNKISLENALKSQDTIHKEKLKEEVGIIKEEKFTPTVEMEIPKIFEN